MAKTTNMQLRSSLIYSVYVRNHGPNGTFADVEADLPRIAALGADILWLMPIHPTGEAQRKGSLGSPYAIRDYRAINPEYGTMEDFKRLCDAIHSHGMRVMIDVVYNHTSPDSVLVQQHPEWFYRMPDGRFGNRAGDWSDVVDLDYANRDLWEYQIQTLQYWVGQGVDGFRCDVASVVPVEFWCEARRRVEETKPGVVWLAESVHPEFLQRQRHNGYECHSDSELFEAFDITYDYDIHSHYAGYFAGANSLAKYLEAMARQETTYPRNFLKLRFLENHDQPRFAGLVQGNERRDIWTAFTYFVRGTTLLYAGQEAQDENLPSLFDRDPVNWAGLNDEHTAFLQRLAALRKDALVQGGRYAFATDRVNPSVAVARYFVPSGESLVGVFNLALAKGEAEVPLEDGVYENLAASGTVRVKDGRIALSEAPVILRGKAA